MRGERWGFQLEMDPFPIPRVAILSQAHKDLKGTPWTPPEKKEVDTD